MERELARQDSSDQRDAALSAEPMLANEPTHSTDAADPTEAIDSTEPTEPMESTDPCDHRHRTEFSEPIDHLEPRRALDLWCTWVPKRVLVP